MHDRDLLTNDGTTEGLLDPADTQGASYLIREHWEAMLDDRETLWILLDFLCSFKSSTSDRRYLRELITEHSQLQTKLELALQPISDHIRDLNQGTKIPKKAKA